MSKDFVLKKIDVGLELYNFTAFNPNDSVLNLSNKLYFEELKEFLQKNMKVIVTIKLYAHDSYFSDMKYKETYYVEVKKKKVKKQRTITITAEEQAKRLLDARAKNLTDYLESINVREKRYVLEYDYKYNISKPKQVIKKKKSKTSDKPEESKNTPNLNIKVSKMLKL